jgi:hypothetical protein
MSAHHVGKAATTPDATNDAPAPAPPASNSARVDLTLVARGFGRSRGIFGLLCRRALESLDGRGPVQKA